MKLTDLDPRWLLRSGQRVGFIFKSPINANWYQSCVFGPTPTKEQWDLFNDALDVQGEEREYAHTRVQACDPGCRWVPSGDIAAASFDTLSVTPSIDGSRGGMWHGFVTGGQIVGGV